MRLYHGTNAEMKAIDLNQSRIGKDFGLGFYLTTDRNVAFRQAERKFVQYGEGNGCRWIPNPSCRGRCYYGRAILGGNKISYGNGTIFVCNRKCRKIIANIMNGKEIFMIETLTRELIARLMEERHLSMREAMDVVYQSKTYTALNNLNTGLYFQSPAYVYDVLEQELKTREE